MNSQINLACALVKNLTWATPVIRQVPLGSHNLLSKRTISGSLLANISSRLWSEESYIWWAKQRISGSIKGTCLLVACCP